MIQEWSKFVVFNFNNGWILTREKVASSWLKDNFKYECIEVFINNYTFKLELLPFNSRSNSQITDSRYDEIEQKFHKDWDIFIDDTEQNNNFIFLIRHPIYKFISGWVQDSVIRKTNSGYLESEQQRLYQFFEKDLVDSFINFINKTIKDEIKLGPAFNFPDVNSLPLKYKEIYEEFCFPKNNDFFKNDIQSFINLTSVGHPAQDLFIIWKLCFKDVFPNNKNKIHIFDIDLQNISQTLFHQFDIELLHENNSFLNKRGEYLLNKSYKYLAKNYDIINTILGIEIFFWFEIVSKLYPKNLIPSLFLKSISSFKKKYFIPDTLDFYNIETHMRWHFYEPTQIELKYF